MGERQSRHDMGPEKASAAAEPLVAAAFAIAGLVLLSRIGIETKRVDVASMVLQPAFWPAVGLAFMTGFSIWRLAVSGRKGLRIAFGHTGEELRALLAALEYLAWFLAYVFLVPRIGYLAATLLFTVLLAWRLGYRSARSLLVAALFGIAVVVFFKSFLSVKIPGGAIYEAFPPAIRNFMIQRL